ncbi:MAG: DUF433 domain-containing protein [Burkholderiales bacterium]|nr:DUF433 domain-containing protein [Burkholderiales bacterium]
MDITDRTAAVRDEPAYRASEVAHILALPAGTVKAWAFGQNYRYRDGRPKRFVKLIEAADSRRRLLSFNNLCELYVLSALRRKHRIPMPVVRDSLDFVSRELRTQRPLIARQFLTNGLDLFFTEAGRLLNASRQGQHAMDGDFERALQRIERDDRGTPVRLFPVVAPAAGDREAASGAVVIDPRLAFGRPALARAGVTTEVIADRFIARDAPAEMAADYGVDEADIWDAIRFELEPQRRAAA